MASIFSRIIAGEIPGRFVWTDDVCVGLIDVGPLRPGHCLVIPRVEVDHWLDLDDDVALHCYRVARAIGAAQMRVFAPARIGLIVAGYEVPHTHLHVVPTRGMGDFDFTKADRNPDPAMLDDAAERLRADLRAHGFAEAEAAAGGA